MDMTDSKERISKEIESLVKQGKDLLSDLAEEESDIFQDKYQIWYTQVLQLIKQLLPERMNEFTTLYDDKDTVRDIAGYLLDADSTDYIKEQALMNFMQQVNILESTKYRLDGVLNNIYGLMQAEILDNELDAATELWKAGHIRSAGTVAGVVLERHLATVCSSRALKARKKNPTISDWNDILKDASVYDTPAWRRIQRLADIRNLCTHSKDRDPTKEEVDELIREVERVTKTIF